MESWLLYDFGEDRILAQQGDIEQRFSPCSTFKLPLALMGYDSGILTSPQIPVWHYNEEFRHDIPIMLEQWKQAHNPESWIKNSCLWYSQELTRRLGHHQFRKYVDVFNYGNGDVSGDMGKDNGLTNCWPTSSLQISPREQVEFLTRLLSSTLPLSKSARQQSIEIIRDKNEGIAGDLFAKTGSGFINREMGVQRGWYIGWLERGERKIIFACLRMHQGAGFAGLQARQFMHSEILSDL